MKTHESQFWLKQTLDRTSHHILLTFIITSREFVMIKYILSNTSPITETKTSRKSIVQNKVPYHSIIFYQILVTSLTNRLATSVRIGLSACGPLQDTDMRAPRRSRTVSVKLDWIILDEMISHNKLVILRMIPKRSAVPCSCLILNS